jgi:hypothetical protein
LTRIEGEFQGEGSHEKTNRECGKRRTEGKEFFCLNYPPPPAFYEDCNAVDIGVSAAGTASQAQRR